METICKLELMKLLDNREDLDNYPHGGAYNICFEPEIPNDLVCIAYFCADRCGGADTCIMIGRKTIDGVMSAICVFPRMRYKDGKIILGEDKMVYTRPPDKVKHDGDCNGSSAYLDCYRCSLCENAINTYDNDTFDEVINTYTYKIREIEYAGYVYLDQIDDLNDINDIGDDMSYTHVN